MRRMRSCFSTAWSCWGVEGREEEWVIVGGRGEEEGVDAGFAVHFPLVDVIGCGLLEFAEAVNGPEVAAGAVEGGVVEEETVVFGGVEERAAVVEDVVEEGLELGPPLRDAVQALGDEVDFCAEAVKGAEVLAGGVSL